jgi:xanthine dehydrogenase accessory factor
MGRVYWSGSAEADTGVPEIVVEYQKERVFRSPANGLLNSYYDIGMKVQKDQRIADVSGTPVTAAFDGVIRGLLRGGTTVTAGMKIGDLDPRNDPRICMQVSDKAMAVGGGVLEAVLSKVEIRKRLYI